MEMPSPQRQRSRGDQARELRDRELMEVEGSWKGGM
ncbi:hypothetical protein sce1225 [Sorangium cellulosum So ce56]|uniref:Uncharacterized protein n=1 Tax=Sorangium cellulosum (strain So ce56) TaxID=448385 RepID=A9F1N6_SORC5|nr:hypothetical protein sce1225 [Sorangium cellulosum So ce56]